MARVVVPKQQPPTEISKFLGQNDTPDGQLGLKLGEATLCRNYRITPNYKLKKREGFNQIIGSLIGDVQGMWYGKLNGSNFFLFCNNGHLYKLVTGVKTDLGTLIDAPTSFIPFGTKVYLFNGYEYKSFDGINFITVIGYRPRVFIDAPPTGGGTAFELNNELNGLREGTFTPDNGTTVKYKVSSFPIDSIDYVYKNEVLQTLGTHYTASAADLLIGSFTWIAAPTGNIEGSIRVGWKQGNGNRAYIEKCRFAMDYSGETDSRVFIWGDPTNKSRRRWSGLAGGIPSAEYFESTSYDDIGNGQFAITDIVKQYTMQKIFLEDGCRWSEYSTVTDANGVTVASFPVKELNDEIGNVAFGQVQIIKNSPFSLFSGIHAWNGSNVREQTNEQLISERIQDTLTASDLTQAKTITWHKMKEYWCNIGSVVWIYNYLNDTWYTFDNITATCFLVVNDELYFGKNGSIQKFDLTKRNDNGVAIVADWEMGFFDGGAEWQLKFMNGVWISINPDTQVSADIKYVTDSDGVSDVQTIFYNLHNFVHQNFVSMSFSTSYNPQPKYLEIEAQQFVYIKFIISNSSMTDTLTVLSINMPLRYGGKVQ